jgi:hypothetical protein
MDLQVSRLDIAKTKETWPAGIPFAPALIVAKQPGISERWHIIDAPIVAGEKPQIAVSYADQYLRLPVFAYNLRPEADLALAYMVQLGLSCASAAAARIKKLHVVTGNPVDLLYDEDINKSVGLRYWFGFAYVLSEDVTDDTHNC